MSYSKEYLDEWERRGELLRALTSATAALGEAIEYERGIGNSATAAKRMEALMDHLEVIQRIQPRPISRKYGRMLTDEQLAAVSARRAAAKDARRDG